MGITGLIPFLEQAASPVHLRDLRGATVAVDTYCWLHKGVFGCAEKLVRGEETDQYLQYCLKYVQMLLHYGIKPILVFDGRHLPAKAITEHRRRDARKQAKKRAAELLRLGRTAEARSHMRRCVDVTHAMALRLIRECRRRNVDCVVAPYEADAQMAWLNKVDVAQYIITEDSDLTLFGARQIIFKLDLNGYGQLVRADRFHLAMGCRPEKYDFEKFRRMCILSGCDYLDSLPGIGLAKACKFMALTEETDMRRALRKLPQYLNMRNLEVDDAYIESFIRAEATFRHMWIYNPMKRQMERLHPLEEYDTAVEYCCNAGDVLADSEQALQLALGNLNPFTLQQLDDWHPDRLQWAESAPDNVKRAKHKSIWRTDFVPHTGTNSTAAEEPDTPGNCAIFFKKIDFTGRAVQEEISAYIAEEQAKPDESEIFSLYRREANENERPRMKRPRRRNSSTSSVEAEEKEKCSPPDHHRNPFAKAKTDVAPPICQNRSLLEALSPRKYNARLAAKAPAPVVEVRSRFFAANLSQVTQRLSSPPQPTAPVEPLTAQQKELQALLYDSPSPTKGHGKKTSLLEALTPEEASPQEEAPSLAEVLPPATPVKTELTTTVVLSDTEDEVQKTPKRSSLSAYKAPPTRRLGLTKNPRTNGRGRAAKLSAQPATGAQPTQTRLSMFGFQKRPSLK